MRNFPPAIAAGAAALFCLLAAALSPAQPPPDKAEHRKQNNRKKQARSPKPANKDKNQRSRQQVLQWQDQRGWARQSGAWKGGNSWIQNRAQLWDAQRQTWAQRGGYGGYYIPQDQFDQQFGSPHRFRLKSRPLVVDGYPRFSHAGYQFAMVDPWPQSWAEDWFANDDVYVDYDDGYYLHNRRDPGFHLAILPFL